MYLMLKPKPLFSSSAATTANRFAGSNTSVAQAAVRLPWKVARACRYSHGNQLYSLIVNIPRTLFDVHGDLTTCCLGIAEHSASSAHKLTAAVYLYISTTSSTITCDLFSVFRIIAGVTCCVLLPSPYSLSRAKSPAGAA